MLRPRISLFAVFPGALFLLASVLWGAADPVYFAQVGAGELAGSRFRTQFRLLNERSTPLTGALIFFSSSGNAMRPDVEIQWNPEEGTIQQNDNRIDFEIPIAGLLRLTLVPGPAPAVGYARLESDGNCDVQAFFQFSRPRPGTQLFEEGLIREVEIRPLAALNSASFPLSFVNGLQQLNTAVAVVNLSSAPADATLVRRPDEAVPIRLEPGEVFTGFFDELIPLIEIQIFPLETEALVELLSPVPLAVAVVRTLEGFPLSGVQVARVRPGKGPVPGQLGEEIKIPLGSTVRFDEADLELTFWNVLEDSRCPTGVVCVWQGRVRTIVRALLNSADQSELEFTLLGDHLDTDVARVGDFRVEAKRVDPYPDINLGPIEASQYQMTLLVTRVTP